ncbi:MAG: 2'-5' RNA ligase family protein [Sphingomonadaceae bacterium]|nr:2'-5' RNA ligase family protein [Sphingomonadaceae bacterium]
MASDAPLILTAQLPDDLHHWATALRTAHFPPERNYLQAHVTMFHALPPFLRDEVEGLLKRIAAGTAPVPAHLEGIMSLGRGTALKLSSPAMLDLRAGLAEHFHGMLTPQDQHQPRLHVTIQNKVSPAEAQALQEKLAPTVQPRTFVFRGLALYAYLGGPWELLGSFAFRGKGRA